MLSFFAMHLQFFNIAHEKTHKPANPVFTISSRKREILSAFYWQTSTLWFWKDTGYFYMEMLEYCFLIKYSDEARTRMRSETI